MTILSRLVPVVSSTPLGVFFPGWFALSGPVAYCPSRLAKPNKCNTGQVIQQKCVVTFQPSRRYPRGLGFMGCLETWEVLSGIWADISCCQASGGVSCKTPGTPTIHAVHKHNDKLIGADRRQFLALSVVPNEDLH